MIADHETEAEKAHCEMNVQTTKAELREEFENSRPAMRSDSLSRLAAGVARREAEKPDFEAFIRTEIFQRIDEMLDLLAENITGLAVDDTVEDLLLAKNAALSDAMALREKAESSANHYKQLEKTEGDRRHKIIVQLREELADLTEKYEHQKNEGLRRHNLIIELREQLEAAEKKAEHERQEGLRRHDIILELRKSLEAAEKKIVFHQDERQAFLSQRRYTRTFRYMVKTAPARALELIGLKKAPPVE